MASRTKEIQVRDEISVELFRENFGVEVGAVAFSPMVVAGVLGGIRVRLIEMLDDLGIKYPEFSRIEQKISAKRSGFSRSTDMSFTKNRQRLTAVVSGAAFLIILLALAIAVPDPSPFQYVIFRITLALAAAAFSATIPGFLEVTVSSFARATGAIAVFLIVYFFSPANLVTGDRETGKGVPRIQGHSSSDREEDRSN